MKNEVYDLIQVLMMFNDNSNFSKSSQVYNLISVKAMIKEETRDEVEDLIKALEKHKNEIDQFIERARKIQY